MENVYVLGYSIFNGYNAGGRWLIVMCLFVGLLGSVTKDLAACADGRYACGLDCQVHRIRSQESDGKGPERRTVRVGELRRKSVNCRSIADGSRQRRQRCRARNSRFWWGPDHRGPLFSRTKMSLNLDFTGHYLTNWLSLSNSAAVSAATLLRLREWRRNSLRKRLATYPPTAFRRQRPSASTPVPGRCPRPLLRPRRPPPTLRRCPSTVCTSFEKAISHHLPTLRSKIEKRTCVRVRKLSDLELLSRHLLRSSRKCAKNRGWKFPRHIFFPAAVPSAAALLEAGPTSPKNGSVARPVLRPAAIKPVINRPISHVEYAGFLFCVSMTKKKVAYARKKCLIA